MSTKRSRSGRALPRVAALSTLDQAIADVISERTGLAVHGARSLGASGWAEQRIFSADSGEQFFVKCAAGRPATEMFQGEALGLQAMHATQSLRLPEVIAFGDVNKGSYIIMEHLNFGRSVDQAELGRQLGRMHAATPASEQARSGMFGFEVDNTIGGTPQPNKWASSWVNFFREQRLMHQVDLTRNAQLKRMAQPVADNLEVLFQGCEVTPSTLHGDLWSGNIASVDGAPAVFDPATYYGHSEAEFGMSWCAGFTPAFFNAYFAVVPRQPGFEERRDLYLLYHYLNHYNLFGSGYLGECQRLLTKLQRAVDRKSL